MKLLLIITIFLAVSSCGHQECNLNDYRNGTWQTIDTIVSYKLCSGNNKLLLPSDSIQIEYLGLLKDSQNILVQNIFTVLPLLLLQ